ncbi:MAG: tRNA (N(6)-L-threonylcarbamoyladenosine(37)-C(2))-methylthiotransferase MtaB [Alphaproteobacteria bacterium]|nr:tRNA (N(6)-L-threonylcarbamoyladenosine(37)-C(2))-methylthiotransferase MtaB [Alphaproteobacteria bacterium]
MSAPTARGVDVVTFGCRLNSFESDVIRAQAERAGLTDTVVVNTCAVTAEAERQARQAIRKLRRQRPSAAIIVAGCAAQLDPARFAAMPEVDRVLGNAEKLDARVLADRSTRVAVNDIMAVTEGAQHLIAGFAARARAFIEIQNGCDHRCTFCIIPFARGPNRSVAPDHIVRQVERLVDQGFAEVVLTGVDIGDWGRDLAPGSSLAALVAQLLRAVPALPRLRLSSIDPSEIDDSLIELFATEPRLMPHAHLSLQSGAPMILKRMKRRHAPADAIRVAERLRTARPGIVFGADLIAGFPTESDGMAETTLRHVDEVGLTYLHVFPYSERPGTPAARMRQVPMPVRKERAERLRIRAAERLDSFLRQSIGSTVEALVETSAIGRTPHYAEVRFAPPSHGVPPSPGPGAAARPRPGAIVRAHATGVAAGTLLADLA